MANDIPKNKDNKNVEKLIDNLKDKINPTEEQLDKLKEMANKYSGKSEEELVFEIIKLNKMFSEKMSEEEYLDKIKKLERIRPFLNEQQEKKLNKLLEILQENK
ncbi:hypothetical protein [Caldisalinibacter kiritimatiensis]|uniref:Uncharacterized protein n=1 Tax=Caldisalinibacter kiritimatiensis TaxID=1304284 RepID=R1AWS7_9FIRM|nr:hypothetical protein [Caldisalinibacter kiritimatiensis]EOD01648.1 hypothetical protein L21TH_0254 [Caldisalinibacter kiritimatiensis]